MDHVGRGVGARDRTPALEVDRSVRSETGGDLARDHLRLVHDQPGDRRLHVVHFEPSAVRELDHTLVGELAAALGVERRAVQHQLDLVAGPGRLHDAAGSHDAAHRALVGRDVVPGELDGATHRVDDLAVGTGVAVLALLGTRVVLGPLALLVHQPAEAVLVDREPLLRGHLEGDVDREAVGVVQGECLVAAELAATGLLHLGGRHVEDRRARAGVCQAAPRRTRPSRSRSQSWCRAV